MYEIIIKWPFMGKGTGEPSNILVKEDLIGIFFATIDACHKDPREYHEKKQRSPYPWPGFLYCPDILFQNEIG